MKTIALPIALFALLCFAPLLHAQDDSAKRAAAAEEMLKSMHLDDMMAKIMASQKESIKKMSASFMPKGLSPEAIKRAQDLQDAGLDIVYKQLTWESLKPDFIQIYSEVYTEQELKDLTAFYNSPIGQKFIEKMPELQAKTMEIMQKRMVTLMPAIQAAIKDAMEKAKTPENSAAQPSQL